MNNNELINRIAILYGNEYPILMDVERAMNSSDPASYFKVVSYGCTDEDSRSMVKLLHNVLLNGEHDNLDMLFGVIEFFASSGKDTEVLSKIWLTMKQLIKSSATLSHDPEIIKSVKYILSFFDCSGVISAISDDASEYKFFEYLKTITNSDKPLIAHLRKFVKRFDTAEFALDDSLSIGQLKSKLWLVDTIRDMKLSLGDSVYVCAGWYGVLPALMFERADDCFSVINSFDIDPSTARPADTLNKDFVSNGRFQVCIKNIQDLNYTKDHITVSRFKYTDLNDFEESKSEITCAPPTCVINTSCEHIEDFDTWWNSIPKNMLVILQNNDFVEHEDDTVVNTVTNVDEFAAKLNLTETKFAGTLSLEKYNRFMIIGRK